MMKYLLLTLTLFACHDNPQKENNSVQSKTTEILDTIISRPTDLVGKPLQFEGAFIKGATDKVRNTTLEFYGINMGNLKITSGKIIACDPMNIDEYGISFTQVFPAGEFPVQLSLTQVDDREVIAFARIKFSDAAVAKWAFALKPGETALSIWGKKMRGYSTDSGTGVYLDEVANKPLDREEVTSMDRGIYSAMDKHARHGRRYAMYNFGTYNLAAYSTAFGDGFYGTYIGFDAQGKPCRLLTDFGIVNWKKK